MPDKNRYCSFCFLPSAGICLFTALYIYSATLYPGGSQADLHSTGFDWVNNYWCNLMNEKAMNGQINPARPMAIVAMVVLCSSLASFFVQFASKVELTRFWRRWIAISGVCSMFTTVWLFTEWHDIATIIASVFGLATLIGVMYGLVKNRMRGYLLTCGLIAILLGVNNYIYYTEQGLGALPLLQKISFAVVLLWVVAVNRSICTKKQPA
jgi:hypothetical protein